MEVKKRRIFSSIKFKVMIGTVFLISLTMIGVSTVVVDKVRSAILNESLDKGQVIARNLSLIAEEAILTMDDTSLFIPLSKSVEESRGIVYAFITDKNGRIIAHNDVGQVDANHTEPEALSVIERPNGYRIVSHKGKDGLVYEVDGTVGGVEKLGNIHVGIAASLIDEAVRDATGSIALISILGLIVGAIGAVVLASLQVKPILLLAKGVRAIGEGHFNQQIEISRNDEIGDLTLAFNDMTKGLQEREFIRQTFQKFVHKNIADQLLKNPDMIKVGGEKIKATIIFTDIRGFTSISERLSPEEVITLLNDYFAELVPIIDKNDGILDKFIGDAMMIVFGTPVSKPDDALRAIRAGLEMKAAVAGINARRSSAGKETITMGIGINTGYVVAGNVGSEDRMEYTVLGDVVNIAARLEGQSRTGDVIISDATYAEVKSHVVASKSEEMVSLKGKSGQVHIYTVEKLLQES